MMIDKVSGVNPLNNLQNVRRSNAVGAYRAGSDEISVSDEAKELAESYYLNQVRLRLRMFALSLSSRLSSRFRIQIT